MIAREEYSIAVDGDLDDIYRLATAPDRAFAERHIEAQYGDRLVRRLVGEWEFVEDE